MRPRRRACARTSVSPSAILLLLAFLERSCAAAAPDYLPYCSKLDDAFDARAPPRLGTEDLALAPTLTLVITVIRHGARTLANAQPLCWPGYNVTWDCTFTTSVGPSNATAASRNVTDGRVGPVIFAKTFDGGPTYLGGTCEQGALLAEGYSQQLRLGGLLRDAYVGNESHQLFPSTNLPKFPEGSLYLRSDDMQRTIASGQALTTGFFGLDALKTSAGSRPKVLDWHMGDMETDDMFDNNGVCPRLAGASGAARDQPEYIDIWSSSEAQALQAELEAAIGGSVSLDRMHDCLLTALCADKGLPEGVTLDHVQRVHDLAQRGMHWTYSYNDSYVSRLGMGFLLADMLPLVQAAGSEAARQAREKSGGYGRFAMFSGHDSTITPLLAALAPREFAVSVWPPYASNLILEVYVAADGRPLFRALFNGRVLRMEGCDSSRTSSSSSSNTAAAGATAASSLCDLSVLLEVMEAIGGTAATDCQLAWPPWEGDAENAAAARSATSSSDDVFTQRTYSARVLVGVSAAWLFAGAILGWSLAAALMRRALRKSNGHGVKSAGIEMDQVGQRGCECGGRGGKDITCGMCTRGKESEEGMHLRHEENGRKAVEGPAPN